MIFNRTRGIHSILIRFKTKSNLQLFTEVNLFMFEKAHTPLFQVYANHKGIHCFYLNEQYFLCESAEELEFICTRNFFQICTDGKVWMKFQCDPPFSALYPPNAFVKDGHPLLEGDGCEFKINNETDVVEYLFINIKHDYE